MLRNPHPGKGLVDGGSTNDHEAEAHAGGGMPLYQRAVVHEVLFDPASLTDEQIETLNAQVRFSINIRDIPRNAIVAERIRNGSVEISGKEIFYPFFPPHFALPVKPGEHVWVMFEDPAMTDTQGFWMCRISEPRSVDDLNHTHADRKFDRRAAKSTLDKGGAPPKPGFHNGVVGAKDGEDVTIRGTASIPGGPKAYEEILKGDKAAEATKVHDYESVPRFTKRPSDNVLQGSNNTLLFLGTDRTGAAATITDGKVSDRPADDQKVEAGTVGIVVGRGRKEKTAAKKVKNSLDREEVDKSAKVEKSSEGDLDPENDSAMLFVSMKTKADKNFKIKHGKLKSTSSESASAAIVKADQVRIVAREDMKFIVKPTEDTPDDKCAMFVVKKNGDIVFIPSAEGIIKLGGDDADLAVLCTRAGAVNGGGTVTASPIVDTMGGAQGGSDGLNGTFAKKIMMK